MDLRDNDRKYLWHPFTQMKGWINDEEFPIIERGEGCMLYDTEGKAYIDGVSSLWCNIHGHRRREIDDAIRGQIDKIAHSTFLGLSNVPAVELAEKLLAVAPKGLTRVFYSDSGSEAVEIATKIAYQYWQQCGDPSAKTKKKFITLAEAYHGDTIGAVSLGGVDLFTATYRPLLFETINVPTPYFYRSPFKSHEECGNHALSIIENILKTSAHEIAAMVMEPLIQGAAGMITQPPGFLRKIADLCAKYNVLLILDEVATGFGRTGKMFACQHEGVAPDLMAVAKGLTGGYLPLAATLAKERIFEAFLGDFGENKTFFHGHTFTANQICCSAAIASLKIFEEERTLEKLQGKIALLREKLAKFRELPWVGDIRQCGAMVGIELVKDRSDKTPFPYSERIGHKIILEARKRGAILRPLGDVVVLMPPLSIPDDTLDRLIDIAKQSVVQVCSSRAKDE